MSEFSDEATCRFFSSIGFTTGEMSKAMKISTSTIKNRARKYGISFPNKPSLHRRFHKSYLRKDTGCWEWIGAARGNGYGCLMDGGRLVSAHRLSYELFHGPIADGMFICHKCDNRKCVNPNHLFSGTPAENTRDMHQKGRARPVSGPRHHASKLSTRQVESIRSSELRISDLARRYDVYPSLICKIRSGEARKNG